MQKGVHKRCLDRTGPLRVVLSGGFLQTSTFSSLTVSLQQRVAASGVEHLPTHEGLFWDSERAVGGFRVHVSLCCPFLHAGGYLTAVPSQEQHKRSGAVSLLVQRTGSSALFPFSRSFLLARDWTRSLGAKQEEARQGHVTRKLETSAWNKCVCAAWSMMNDVS